MPPLPPPPPPPPPTAATHDDENRRSDPTLGIEQVSEGDNIEDQEAEEEEVEEVEEEEEEEGEEEEEEEEEAVEEEIEEEEEEVEVEEEEEGEEVEEEDDDDDHEYVEEKTGNSSEEAKDIRQDNESEGHNEQVGSYSAPDQSELKPPCESAVEDGNCRPKFPGPINESLGMQLVESYQDQLGVNEVSAGKNRSQLSAVEEGENMFLLMKENSKQCGDSNAYLHGTKGMASDTTSTCIIMGTQGDADLVKGNCLDEKPSIVMGSEIQDVPMDLGSDKELISSSRLATSNIKTRSLSPSSEFKDGNKRPAVICDFFVKGWCIRGSSCRFLHINDNVDNTNQQPEAVVSSTNLTREDQLHEGMNTDKPNLLGSDQLNASSTGKDAAMCHLSARILLPHHQDTQILCKFDEKHKFSSPQREDLSFAASQPFPSSICDPKVSQFKDAGVEDNMKNWPGSGYGSHPSRRNSGSSRVVQQSLLAEHRSLKDSALTSSNYYNGDPSSQMSRLEVLKCIQSQHVSSSSRDPSFSSSAMVPAHRTSTWVGPALSFSTSVNANMHGLQKLLDNDREHHVTRSSSLLQRASSFSGSEPENLPQTSASAEPSYYGEHKAMISSNDWEPSIPFQPSFSMTPATLSSVGSQYDPFHDSIDSSVGRKSFKFSFFNQENTVLNASHQLISDDSLLSQNPGQECNGDKGSMSSHIRFPENLLDKNERPFVPRYPEEENASTTSCVKNIPKKTKVDVDHNARKVSDGSRRKRFMSNDDIEVDQKTEGDVAKETKALRHFRAALVDFVKDILKPTWREGHLSKDAHNMIVKKTVEKVVSALQTHQAPATVDSIKQYLSSSQSKITKLVEGYVTKYRKS